MFKYLDRKVKEYQQKFISNSLNSTYSNDFRYLISLFGYHIINNSDHTPLSLEDKKKAPLEYEFRYSYSSAAFETDYLKQNNFVFNNDNIYSISKKGGRKNIFEINSKNHSYNFKNVSYLFKLKSNSIKITVREIPVADSYESKDVYLNVYDFKYKVNNKKCSFEYLEKKLGDDFQEFKSLILEYLKDIKLNLKKDLTQDTMIVNEVDEYFSGYGDLTQEILLDDR